MTRGFGVLAVAMLTAGCLWQPGPAPADLVLRHGRIYPMTGPGVRVAAIAIANGRIVYAGDDDHADAYVGASTREVDLGGRAVLPGLIDAHVHLLEGGLEARDCQIVNLDGKQAVFNFIRKYARTHPTLKWIRGTGWELPTFPGANPRKEWLDALVPDRPAYFPAADAHSAWVNSRALALAHINKDTPDPPGGRIERDPRTGEPSGTLREKAMLLVARLLPPHTREEMETAARDSLARAARLGLTGAFEANDDQDMLAAYQALDRAGKLTMRITAAQSTHSEQGPAQVAQLVAWRKQYASPMFAPTSAKIFIDGVLESHTAAMLAPYLDGKTGRPSGQSGTPLWSPAQLDATVVALDAAGIQVHMHAIGDRAVRMGLDAVAAARRAHGANDLRHTIAHLEVVDPADVPRFRPLGVIADFQPFWAYRDDYIKGLTEPVMGPARSARLYPIGDLKRAGAHLAFGSDWSVSSLSPLDGMEVAVTRRDPAGPPGAPWLPDQVVDRYTAVAGYTSGAAYTCHREHETGTLEVGKAADLVVLDDDVFTVPAAKIHAVKPVLTMVGGRAVYRVQDATGLADVPNW